MENHASAAALKAASAQHSDPYIVRREQASNNISSTPQYQPATPSFFLRLPFELRIQIYGLLIPRNRYVDVSSPRFGVYDAKLEDNQDSRAWDQDSHAWVEVGENERYTTTTHYKGRYCPQDWKSQNYKAKLKNSIFLLSKQIGAEALNVLYGDNIFKLCLDGYDEIFLMENFADTNWRRMTKMLINVKPFTYERIRMDMDEGFWAFMLPRLTHLKIVVDASLHNLRHDPLEATERIGWLIPRFECLGRYLSSRTVVEVDEDGCKQVQDLINRYIPGEHLKVECGIVESLVLKTKMRLVFTHTCRCKWEHNLEL